MKQGTSRSRGDAGDRPQHRVRAAAHHAHALAPVSVEARLEHARHQALRADGAVLGGEVQGEAHRLHLGQQHEVRGCRGRRRASPTARPASARPRARPACRGAEAPPRRRRADPRSRARASGRWCRAARGHRPPPRAANARAAPCPVPPFLPAHPPFRRPARPTSEKKRGATAGRGPKPLESLRIVRVWRPQARAQPASRKTK